MVAQDVGIMDIMRHATVVQLPRSKEVGTFWVPVVDPEEITDGAEGTVVPITVHLSTDDAEFLERYAAYRNNLADTRGDRLKARWSRKSMAESFLTAQVRAIRRQLDQMLNDLGDLPPKKSAEAAKYAKRAAEWAAKRRG